MSLQRVVGLGGAILMGLGSIIGTGVFVSIGIGAGVTGSWVIASLFLAGCLATCNGLSTAQLAAAHPVSGGTYEYGYRYLNDWMGFSAGWLFLLAKSASAATAAIGFGGYFNRVIGVEVLQAWQIGLMIVVGMTVVCLLGMKRSNFVNIVLVSLIFASLLFFLLQVCPHIEPSNFTWDPHESSMPSFFEATALMFVAYTGYGRVATLGEEIKDPQRNIPRAVILTLFVSFLTYLLVAWASIGAVGAETFYAFTLKNNAPLEMIISKFNSDWMGLVVAIGAMAAMLGVLLNLLLGLSRIAFAMGRKNDLPPIFGQISEKSKNPHYAILLCGTVVFLLVLFKDVKATWSFSAFTVLLYYSVTNLSALQLPVEKRLYPRFLAWMGLFGCLGLGLWVDINAVLLGSTILGAGIVFRIIRHRMVI